MIRKGVRVVGGGAILAPLLRAPWLCELIFICRIPWVGRIACELVIGLVTSINTWSEHHHHHRSPPEIGVQWKIAALDNIHNQR